MLVNEVYTTVKGLIGKPPESRYGLKSGWPAFDRSTRGFLPGKLYTVAARPGGGKTSWCTSLISGVIKQYIGGVLMISTELDECEVVAQVMECHAGGIPLYPNRRSSCEEEMDALRLSLAKVRSAMETNMVRIVHAKRLSTEFVVRSTDDYANAIGGSVLVLVDQVNRIRRKDSDGYAIATEHMLNEMEEIAGKTACPIVLMSQLSRAADSHEKPTVADIKHSGAFEEFSHAVYLLHLEKDEHRRPTGYANVIVAKNRSGMVGEIEFQFDGECHTWSERQERYAEAR